jgi:hypothetical protein
MTDEFDPLAVWLDALTSIWDGMNAGGGKQVKSFLVVRKNELPPAITVDMAPCAVSYTTSLHAQYSLGGPTKFYWEGETDFHLTPGVQVSNYALMLPMFGRIFAAAAANLQLGGKVKQFLIPDEKDAVQLFVFMNAENKPDHQGIVVRWTVEQHVTGKYVIKS